MPPPFNPSLFETPRTSNALLILNYLKRLEPRMPGILKIFSRAFGAWGIYLDGLEQLLKAWLVIVAFHVMVRDGQRTLDFKCLSASDIARKRKQNRDLNVKSGLRVWPLCGLPGRGLLIWRTFSNICKSLNTHLLHFRACAFERGRY